MGAVVRAVSTWMAAWAALIALFLLPLVLPDRWQYYIYSPASVALWMLSMLVGPVVTCVVARRWIRIGVRKTGGGAGRT
ncbi:hypothetical protein [Kitasatospora sp. NPDC058190]|uniref:hypothetical protein n=1 Tax=Kitasatospora sp. NPDC058190 TaxID=3346371 RepID=UPI0036D88F5B